MYRGYLIIIICYFTKTGYSFKFEEGSTLLMRARDYLIINDEDR